ncbi:MAG: 30S ribosomal protein S8 [Cytophagales bacterium]
MTSDQIADYLTRIRNAIKAKHIIVNIPKSNIKKEITKLLYKNGYIKNYKFYDKENIIKIALKYNNKTKESAIVNLKRISKPGLRKYSKIKSLPSVINGLGIAILSTSKGILSDKEAKKDNIGGEILCYIY